MNGTLNRKEAVFDGFHVDYYMARRTGFEPALGLIDNQLHPDLPPARRLVDPSGLEPEFQPSEGCALSIWTTNRKLVHAEGFEPPNLTVRSRVSYPVERRAEKTLSRGWLAASAVIPPGTFDPAYDYYVTNFMASCWSGAATRQANQATFR